MHIARVMQLRWASCYLEPNAATGGAPKRDNLQLHSPNVVSTPSTIEQRLGRQLDSTTSKRLCEAPHLHRLKILKARHPHPFQPPKMNNPADQHPLIMGLGDRPHCL